MNRLLLIHIIAPRIAGMLLLAAPLLVGHDPGMSSATAIIRGTTVKVRVTLPVEDAVRFSESSSTLVGSHAQPVQLEVDGALVKPSSVRSVRLSEERRYELEYSLDALPSTVLLRSTVVDHLPAGHRQFVSVRGAAGESLAACLLSRDANTCRAEVPSASVAEAADSKLAGFTKLVWLLLAASLVFMLRSRRRRGGNLSTARWRSVRRALPAGLKAGARPHIA